MTKEEIMQMVEERIDKSTDEYPHIKIWTPERIAVIVGVITEVFAELLADKKE